MVDLDGKTVEELMVYLFHPKLRSIYTKFKDKIDILIKPEMSSQGKQLLEYLGELQSGVGSEGLYHYLMSRGMSQESSLFYSRFLGAIESYDPCDFNAVHDRVRNFLLRRMTNKAINDYEGKGDPMRFIAQVEEMKASSMTNEFLDERSYSIARFDSLDPDKLNEDISGKVIRSSIPIMNESSSLGGYLRNQMSCIAASPGSGKSLLAMRECLAFADPEYQGIPDGQEGLHILYSAFGDLRQYDFMTRMCAQVTHRPFGYVEMNLASSFEETIRRTSQFEHVPTGERCSYRKMTEKVCAERLNASDFRMIPGSSYMKNITIETYLPDRFTASEYLGHIQNDEYMDTGKTIHEWADVIVVDYDANIRSEEQMYLKGEEIYQTLYQLTFPDKLVLMISQLAKASWSEDIIGLGALNESSRKQMIIDTLLTMSHLTGTNAANHIGYMNLCKNRRGSLKVCPYFRDLDGNFYALDTMHYEAIKGSSDTKTFIQDAHLFTDSIPGSLGIMDAPAEPDITTIDPDPAGQGGGTFDEFELLTSLEEDNEKGKDN